MLRQTVPPGIDHNQFCPVQLGPHDQPADGGQLHPQIHPVHNNHLAATQFADRVGRRRHSQHVPQHGDAVVAVRTRPVIEVVRAHDTARQFLQQVTLLIGTARRVEKGQRVRPVAITNLPDPPGEKLERLLPTHVHQPSLTPQPRRPQPLRRTGHLVHVPPSHADPPPVRRMRKTRVGTRHPVVCGFQVDPAPDTAECARGQRLSHVRLISPRLAWRACSVSAPNEAPRRTRTQLPPPSEHHRSSMRPTTLAGAAPECQLRFAPRQNLLGGETTAAMLEPQPVRTGREPGRAPEGRRAPPRQGPSARPTDAVIPS